MRFSTSVKLLKITSHKCNMHSSGFPRGYPCTDLNMPAMEKGTVAELHHFYAAPAPAPGENFDAAPAPAALAPAPTLLYNKAKFLKRTKV
jgi:hypothetical protein